MFPTRCDFPGSKRLASLEAPDIPGVWCVRDRQNSPPAGPIVGGSRILRNLRAACGPLTGLARPENPLRYRLLALDVDGTILDSEGVLRPAVREAIASVKARGTRVVLCTGRRYRTTRPILRALGLTGVAVVQNGVVVKDASTGETLHASYVAPGAYATALGLLASLGPPVVYIDDEIGSGIDLVTSDGEDHHPFLTEYLAANRAGTRRVSSLATPPSAAVTMISAMAERTELDALEQRFADAEIDEIRTNLIANKGYQGHILEVVSRNTGKWFRLREIARAEGIRPEEIVAIGDDTNDLEMIENAGLGIAMANATDAVRNAADHVTSSNDEEGAARAIRDALL